MENGILAFPRPLLIKKTDTIFLTKTPQATANYATLNLGDAPFDGISTGTFVGNAAGQYIGVNATSGFNGNLLLLETAGSTRFSVSGAGTVRFATQLGGATGASLSIGGGSFSSTTLGGFQGSTNGTIIGVITTNAFTGSLLDLQVASASNTPNNASDVRLKLDYQGQLMLSQPPQGSATTALVMLSSGGFAGGGAPAFNGSSAGTVIGINAASGYAGNLEHFQVAGVDKWKVDNTGTLTLAGTLPGTAITGVIPAASLTNAKSAVPMFINTFGNRKGANIDGVLIGSFTLTNVGSCFKALTGGTVFTDLTTAANNATTADLSFNFGATNDAFYISHATLKYTGVKIAYTTANVYTATLVWEYWNGASWGTLLTTTPTFLVDSTSSSGALKAAAGTYFITFQPPSDWASTTVNSVAGFYIRLRCSAFTSNGTPWAGGQIQLFPVTAGTGLTAGQHGNITRIDFACSTTLSGATNDTKLLIINGTTGNMYLFTATKATAQVSDTSISLAVNETDHILVQQLQQDGTTEFAGCDLKFTITPT